MAQTDAAETLDRVAKLRALLDRDPDDATSWFTLGRALLDLTRWGEAIDAFHHALARNPRYTAAHRDLGRALLEAGEVAEAARVLRSALELARETGDLQTGREMETFLRRAEKILGVPAARATAAPAQKPAAPAPARTENPEAKALYRRGFDHFANDRHDEAIALYEQALRLDPELAIAWNGLSLAHRQKGDLEAAIDAGRRLIELEPDDALSHTNLSILYQRRGMIAEAEEEKAIAMQIQMKQQARGRR
ncbi:MAG: tetratricopeptide repeat protein [Deltaproteobacteria bacterium]|nr:MAG: tetratricopeptide repeat protein [Deltaproteobacteria bacterium]